jgi:ribosomal subunit interface protein
MNLQITAEGMDLTESIKDMVEEKLGNDLDKYLRDFNEDLKTADVVVRFNENYGFEATFNIALPGHEHFYAQAKAKDRAEEIEPVIVRLREEMEIQLKKYRGKINKDKN